MDNKEYLEWSGTIENSDFNAIRERLSDENIRLLHACMGLSGESGEVVDAFKKHLLYGKPLDRGNLLEECGDILWYMGVMIRTLGSSFDEVMQMNHDKLNKRYPTGYTDKNAILRLDKSPSDVGGSNEAK